MYRENKQVDGPLRVGMPPFYFKQRKSVCYYLSAVTNGPQAYPLVLLSLF